MKSSLAAVEANFDGLVGPTHNYAGLAAGNLASQSHQNTPSNPKLAAQQGLAKMKALADRGFVQAVLPPHQRPDVATLRVLGFTGNDAQVLVRAAREAPLLLAACSSAAAMWTANAATVSPSADARDGRVHFTPANLVANFHRSLEPPTTARVLRAIFADEGHFAHHAPLPATLQFGDEGAANHTRLCADYGAPGIELFVYGRRGFDPAAAVPARFSARQTAEASRTIARLHDLRDDAVLIVQQAQKTIDQGVFHNDVIAVGNRNVLFCHEQAFTDTANTVTRLGKMLRETQLEAIVVREDEVSVAEAVETYLFNSQLLTRSDGTMLLVAPEECRRHARVWPYLQSLLERNGSIREVLTFDLRESMQNGGGPACLRLRVVLTAAERAAIGARIWLDDTLHHDLTVWVGRHYRDRLGPADLADPALLDESRRALDELTRLLQLGAIYPFQMEV
jgi:succinylarginine dihydrolase